jgi:hypothetical protein
MQDKVPAGHPLINVARSNIEQWLASHRFGFADIDPFADQHFQAFVFCAAALPGFL